VVVSRGCDDLWENYDSFEEVWVVHLDWSGWVGVGAVMMAWLGISVWVEQLA
jgi:hypothetical protein